MKKYIGSYDGIRVIVLMWVVFYHLIPSIFKGDVLHEDIDQIKNAVRDQTIILQTIVLPYKEQEEERNSNIRSYVELHDNVYLSDCYAATKHRPELFFDDKIHTGERGAMIMSQLIMKKL